MEKYARQIGTHFPKYSGLKNIWVATNKFTPPP